MVLFLLQIIDGKSDWYGGMNLSGDKKTLYHKYGYKFIGEVFHRNEVNDEDKWKYKKGNNDNKDYAHLDGAFFQTDSDNGVERWYARMGNTKHRLRGKHKEITQQINEDGRKSALVWKDLVNYGIYLYAGNTYKYEDNEAPYYYKEAQEIGSCTYVSMNNSLQYEYWTLDSFNEELERQRTDDGVQNKYGYVDTRLKSWRVTQDGLPGEGFPRIEEALLKHFNIEMVVEDAQTRKKTGRTKIVYNAQRAQLQPENIKKDDQLVAYMLKEKIIGYIVHLDLTELTEEGRIKKEKAGGHWLAIKYFAGTKKWLAFDGSALYWFQHTTDKINPAHYDNGFFVANTFDKVYEKVFNYWTEWRYKVLGKEKFVISKNIIYQCRKAEKKNGQDPANDKNTLDLIPYSPHNYHHDHDDHRYTEYYKDNGYYGLLLFVILEVILCVEGLVIMIVFGCCIGGIIGCIYYQKLRYKKSNDNYEMI